MLLKTLVAFLLIAFVLASGDTPGSSSSPSGSSTPSRVPVADTPGRSTDSPSGADSPSGQDQCFVDPCSLPAPEGCVYKYCRTRERGCTAVYLDADFHEICTDSTPACDNVAACTLDCPYGYKHDSNGCPECECVERVDCSSTTCPQVTCGDNERAVVRSGECCPTCVPSCDSVQCPQLNCTDGEREVKRAYECCGTCRPADSCNEDACPEVECRDGEQKVESGCCKVCVPRVDCSTVMCPELACENGTFPRIDDDHCCPVCKRERECDNEKIECAALNCTDGQVLVRVEDECCPICRDANYCDTVVCPAFTGDCPEDEDYRVRKDGACCSYCAGTVCQDTETHRCDGFDHPVCAPGFYRGDNCTEKVPDSERFSLSIEITVTGLTLTEEDIKFFISNKLNIDAMYVTVDKVGDNTFVITVSWDKTNPPADVDESAIQTQVNQVIAQNSNFSTTTTKKSSAATLVAGSVLAVVALAF